MKIKLVTLALALTIPMVSFAQQNENFYVGNKNNPFTKEDKRFNDWAISIGAGVPLIQSADLTSIKNGSGKNQFGYSAYISVDKANDLISVYYELLRLCAHDNFICFNNIWN